MNSHDFQNSINYSELENFVNEDMLMSGYDFTVPEDIAAYWAEKLDQ